MMWSSKSWRYMLQDHYPIISICRNHILPATGFSIRLARQELVWRTRNRERDGATATSGVENRRYKQETTSLGASSCKWQPAKGLDTCAYKKENIIWMPVSERHGNRAMNTCLFQVS